MTEKENKRFLPILALVNMFLDDRETLLFAWAKASTDETLKDSEISEDLKKRGLEMGIMEEEFQNATDAMLTVNHLFEGKDSDNVAQS